MRYFASYIPLKNQEGKTKKPYVIRVDETGETSRIPLSDPLDFVFSLGADDELWLMMGSTNAAVAAGAHRAGVTVHQLSYTRALPFVRERRGKDGEGRVKISPEDVLFIAAKVQSGLFYPMHPQQGEVLQVIAAFQNWQRKLKARIGYVNENRQTLFTEAAVYRRIAGMSVSSSQGRDELLEIIFSKEEPLKKITKMKLAPERAVELFAWAGKKDPRDQNMLVLLKAEQSAERAMKKALDGCELYWQVFEPVDHIGVAIVAHFIAGIERIERFAKPGDLMIYAGMLGKGGGPLPSRYRTNGKPLSRSPLLNNACHMFQEQMFQYGANSYYGQMIHGQIAQECPCTQEERRKVWERRKLKRVAPEVLKADDELLARHEAAVKQAKIAATRVFLKYVWKGWRAQLASDAA